MKKHIISFGIVAFFILSSFSSLSFGINIDIMEQKTHNDLILKDYHSCYSLVEIPENIRPSISEDDLSPDISKTENLIKNVESSKLISGHMESPWPMYCHDTRHTGRSEYSTANNPFDEKWWFKTTHENDYYWTPNFCFINIAGDGTIYLTDANGWIYAIYPNGTLKWEFDYTKGHDTIWCHPAIDNEGTIYMGTYYGDFYAINPDGSFKWKYKSGDGIFASPTIDNNGVIYFGTSKNSHLYAFNSNGTMRWKYKLISGCTCSSPAITTNGTIYIGDHAGYIYAIYSNGTLKWKVKLLNNHLVPNPPSIAEDGTIYVATCYNEETKSYLFALDPIDANVKWKYEIGSNYHVNPSLGKDGTIYVLVSINPHNNPDTILYAINPDGTEKWTRELGSKRTTDYSEPVISADGTIYVAAGANCDDNKNCLYAFNPDGSIRWCKEFDIPYLAVESSPVIDADGTIYLGLSHFREVEPFWEYDDTLYLHAFNKKDTNAPSAPVINGPNEGISGVDYNYTIVTTDPNGNDVYYSISWGELSYQIPMGPWVPSVLEEIGPFPSGEEITLIHNWTHTGSYTIKVIARDTNNLVSPWSTLEVRIPKIKGVNLNSLYFKILEKFPLLKNMLKLLYF